MQQTKTAFFEYLVDPNRGEKESVIEELQNALSANDDRVLFQYVARQLAAIYSIPFLESPSQASLTQTRFSASIQALQAIEHKNPDNDAIEDRVMYTRGQLAQLVRRQKRVPFYLIALGLSIPMLACICLFVLAVLSRLLKIAG